MSVLALQETPPPGAGELALAAGLVLALGLGLQRLLGRRVLTALPQAPPLRPPWSWGDGVGAVGVELALMVLLSAAVLALRGDEPPGPVLALLVALGVQGGVLVWFVLRARGHGLRDAFGLRFDRAPAWVLGSAAYGVLSAPLLLGGVLLWSTLWLLLTGELPVQDVGELMRSARGNQFLAAAVLGVLVIPVLEELVFRGGLLGLLQRRLGPRAALWGSSLLFALLHGSAAFGPILVLALLMGTVYQRTRSILAPVTLHVLNNGVQFLLLYLGTSTP